MLRIPFYTTVNNEFLSHKEYSFYNLFYLYKLLILNFFLFLVYEAGGGGGGGGCEKFSKFGHGELASLLLRYSLVVDEDVKKPNKTNT